MERAKAAKLEGMLLSSRKLLEDLADHVREDVPESQRLKMMLKIGTATAELIAVSISLRQGEPASMRVSSHRSTELWFSSRFRWTCKRASHGRFASLWL